jgi:hypothetical protein
VEYINTHTSNDKTRPRYCPVSLSLYEVELNGAGKRSSLLQDTYNYDRKIFFSIGSGWLLRGANTTRYIGVFHQNVSRMVSASLANNGKRGPGKVSFPEYNFPNTVTYVLFKKHSGFVT